jgi:hypothetical protein
MKLNHVMNSENDEPSKPFEDRPLFNKTQITPVINPGWKIRGYGLNVVKDPDAPIYYSQRAIFAFTILFGVVFGGGMLAVNVKKAGHKNVGTWIAIFGLLFSTAEIVIFSNMENKSPSLTYLGNALGGLILDFLWHRYIGYNALYRAKAIWKPLIIALVIYIPIFVLIIWGDSMGV